MKANEAKSKFVYPDKLYARCKDNKTLDISYAPQTMKAVEYIRTDAFIEKACEWLKENFSFDEAGYCRTNIYNTESMIYYFKKYMEVSYENRN